MTGARDFQNSPRVFVVGGDPDVLAFVMEEVGACGIQVEGVTIDRTSTIDEASFDLVAFGAGVGFELRRELEARFRRLNPNTRFLRTYAPYAASQIVAAVRVQNPPQPVELDTYLNRIGYAGPLEPTIDTLRTLQERHLASIPFEAIDVLLGRGVDITPDAVDAKLIGNRRGGYCYEQNGLFKRVLQRIGFEVEPLVAAVRWGAQPGSAPPPRAHMALRVTIEGVPWLVDVGFGSSVPPAPLRLDTRHPQPTRYGQYRIIPLGGGLLVQAEVAGSWVPLYDLSNEQLLDTQFELFNWYASTHDRSHFRHQLIVARTTPEARYSLLDGRFSVRFADGRTERHFLDVRGIEQVIQNHFVLHPEPSWAGAFEVAAGRSALDQVPLRGGGLRS
ncbi:arylamine N-acetyltransferase [Sphingomonas sp.]|jgi:N-hydroxyarylamine O-acetyltransferase|uniref:arylamine N-acetyltransferase family protein n=1 Tax=Sphingomonas sp. TaxID=28214 RepID=UPI002DE8AD34|nr:arylamine N-acetyltransferase [Sphingomonas sp.]